ncbi:class I SAM-dependent methyltransferase [Parasynechococcus sp.]|uniref:class I SAM-dependent methyltransferase n=1 Tax=Parasynechococcus sp. TaxID=3101203 RepID=UPI003703F99B
MQRRLEPELMNGDAQVQAYAAADFSSGDQATIEAIQQLLFSTSPLPSDPLVVDLGCGPGNITLRLAGLFPKSRIIGIDGAESMLAVARERAQQQQEMSFLCQNLQEVLRGPLLGQADLIVSNSLLHHLHQPDLLWTVTRGLAAPGCRALHRDLRRPSSDAEIQQLLLKHLPSAPEVLQHDFAASLAAAFEPQEVTAELHRLGLNQLTVSAEDDRYLVVSGLVKS